MKKRFGIRQKIILPVCVLNLLICISIGIATYSSVKKNYIAMGANQALSVAQLTSGLIDADDLPALRPGDENTDLYREVNRVLQNVLENSDASYLYVLSSMDGAYRYLADTSNQSAIGDPLEEEYIEEVAPVFRGERIATDYIDRSKFGNLISAYVPLYNSDGEVAGAIGVDFDATSILTALNSILISIFSIGALMLVISFVLLLLILRAILRGLGKVNAKLEELVSNNGDLTQSIEVASHDEVGVIAYNINRLLRYIHAVITNISAANDALSVSAAQTYEDTKKSNDEIGSVSAAMQEMSASMEETSASITHITDSTGRMRTALGTMYDRIADGSSLAHTIEEKADALCLEAQTETDSVTQASKELNSVLADRVEKSKAVLRINDLTQNILEISSQTNLLALNASIEAARAGDAGRGFSVVADEISKLASGSADTATEIQEVSASVIQAVNDLAAEAKKMLAFLNDKTLGGYGKLLDTGKQYQADAEVISQMMQEFKEKATVLETEMKEVKESLDAVSTATEENAQGIGTVAASSTSLASLMQNTKEQSNKNLTIAKQLDTEVKKFVL